MFVGMPVAIALLIMMIVAMLMTEPVELDHRAGGLPAAARFVPAGAADHRDRHVDRAVELRPGDAGPAQQADPAAGVDGLRRSAASSISLKQIIIVHHHGGAADDLLVHRQPDAARPRPARHRAGPQDGGAARRRRRPDDLDHLHHGRGARCRRRHDVPDVLRRGRLHRRFHAGRQGVHRGRSRRHRLASGRRARRAPDRPDRVAVVGLFHDRLQGCRRHSRSWRSC